MYRTTTLLLILFPLFSFAQLATEPSSQPTNLRKDGTDLPYTFDLRFDASGADRYLILRSTEPIVATPVDGREYDKGEGLGNAKVFSSSASTFLRVKEMVANTDYYFAIYAYNINSNLSSTANYLTTNPYTITLRSAGSQEGNYYDNITFSSPTLITDLKALINPHTMVDYDDYGQTIVANFFERDTVGGQKVINCQYSNLMVIYSSNFGFNATNTNREHRVPFSWINFTGIGRSDFENTPEGSDIHVLELVDADVNQARLNYPYSNDLSGGINFTETEFKKARDARNKDVAQVRADRRGDCARAMMYMMTCYNGKYADNWSLTGMLSDAENQEVSQLLAWHTDDPVDNYEIARHEYVFSIQGNRNPFIDYPDLVDCIDFTDLSLKGSCGVVGIGDHNSVLEVKVYPNPASDQLTFVLPATDGYLIQINDLSGRLIYSEKTNNQQLSVQTTELAQGYYIYTIQSAEGSKGGKVLIQR